MEKVSRNRPFWDFDAIGSLRYIIWTVSQCQGEGRKTALLDESNLNRVGKSRLQLNPFWSMTLTKAFGVVGL